MLVMSGTGPNDDPFAGMNAALQQWLAMAGGAGGTWAQAKQLAGAIANQGNPEPNVDPIERIAVEQLTRVAELQIAQVTGLEQHDAGPSPLRVVTRAEWAAITLDDYRPLFERLTNSLSSIMREQLEGVEPEDIEELGQMIGSQDAAQLMSMISHLIGPMMLAMMAGSTVGQLGRRAFGAYDLPIPRPPGSPALVVLDNLDAFGVEWSLPRDDLRLWICLDEMCHRAVTSVPHVRQQLTDLLARHAGAFHVDSASLERRLAEVSPEGLELDSLQELLGDPETVLGALRSPEQEELLPHLDAVVSTVEGVVEWTLDQIGERLLTSHHMIAEALRRRRVEIDQASRFVERLFGLELTIEKLDRGRAFVDGVVERAGPAALERLWTDPTAFPTPAELDAPGLWVARTGGDDQPLPELPPDAEIPDFPDLDT
jgi:putative hydrolase